MRTLLLLTIFFISLHAKSQNLYSGTIVDQQSLQGLEGVSIKIIGPVDDQSSKVLMSARDGSFVLKDIHAGGYKMILTAIGYKSSVREIVIPNISSKVDTTFLVKNELILDEVQVTGTKKLLNYKTDRVVLNLDGADIAQGNDVMAILGMSPYVQVANNQIKVQGKTNIAVFLDKQRIPETSLQMVLSTLSGDKIERIEIITAPSSKYDGNTSAVIEIYTKKKKTKGIIGSIEGSLFKGIKAGGSGGLTASINLGKIYFEADANHNTKKMIEKGYQNRSLIKDSKEIGVLNQDIDFSDNNYNSGSYSAGMGYQPTDNDKLALTFRRNYNKYDGLGNVFITKSENGNLSKIDSKNDIRYDINNYTFGTNYSRTLDTLDSRIQFSGDVLIYENEKNQKLKEIIEGETQYTFNNTYSKFNAKTFAIDFDKNYKKLKYSVGTKYVHTQSDNTQLFNQVSKTDSLESRFNESIFALYLSGEYKFSDKVNLSLGLRGENTDYQLSLQQELKRNYFHLLPKVRFDYLLNESYTFSAGYARNINRPSYAKLIPYEFIIDNYTVSRGNSKLIPEVNHELFINASIKETNLTLNYIITNNSLNDYYLYNPETYKYTLTTDNFYNKYQWTLSLSRSFNFVKFWNSNLYLEGNHLKFNYPGLQSGEIKSKSKYYGNLSFYNSFAVAKGWNVEAVFFGSTAFLDGLYTIGAFSNTTLGVRKSLFGKKAFIKLSVSDLFYDANVKVKTEDLPAISQSYLKRDTRKVTLSFKYNFSAGAKSKSKSLENDGNKTLKERLGM
ncbi:TonB-dependent receptor domain-containing protein [Sphingobacterium sp. Lzh-3]|uniref:TonB-dependent receptor domain-containing protein n=1 Tax=Sphingobacterium sp. Lzh-3 TaxID=3382150 RepID=UPI00398D1809